MERLPSGKFATKYLVLSLAGPAFNILRAIGQATLISPDSPVRHPAMRRRIHAVMQEIISIAARVIQNARRMALGLREYCAAFAVFERHHQMLSGLPAETRSPLLVLDAVRQAGLCPDHKHSESRSISGAAKRFDSTWKRAPN